MLSPFHDGMLRNILAGLNNLDEMLCSGECSRTCDPQCTSGTAVGCRIHPQLEECVYLWQQSQMREEDSCSSCRDLIIVQRVIKTLENISPSAIENNRKQEKVLETALKAKIINAVGRARSGPRS